MAPCFAPASVNVQEQPESHWRVDLFQLPKSLPTAASPSSLTVSLTMIDVNWLVS